MANEQKAGWLGHWVTWTVPPALLVCLIAILIVAVREPAVTSVRLKRAPDPGFRPGSTTVSQGRHQAEVDAQVGGFNAMVDEMNAKVDAEANRRTVKLLLVGGVGLAFGAGLGFMAWMIFKR